MEVAEERRKAVEVGEDKAGKLTMARTGGEIRIPVFFLFSRYSRRAKRGFDETRGSGVSWDFKGFP